MYEVSRVCVHLNAQALSWVSTHIVRRYTLILGAQVYVYELSVDPKGLCL